MPFVTEAEAPMLPNREADMLTHMRSAQPCGKVGEGNAGPVIVGIEALTPPNTDTVISGTDKLALPCTDADILTQMGSVHP